MSEDLVGEEKGLFGSSLFLVSEASLIANGEFSLFFNDLTNWRTAFLGQRSI